jgi:hypothetical protein
MNSFSLIDKRLQDCLNSFGKIDQSLVYYDGYLLNEPSSYLYAGEESYAANYALHGEIRAFDDGTNFKVFKTIDEEEAKWYPVDFLVSSKSFLPKEYKEAITNYLIKEEEEYNG